ncbi:hypothetical protein BU23DRAFT_244699 [Bimuria novae-zelandiae CBS 107.79]|uniref:C2H2-type domain-containing protein n=1 Tax=Bimuria novae-zelandiae CBS 107.79 TaxID=1447943 RepID=A0A6A5UWV3_9PLEO|nr:hypothetical protein BU23DRAFT_244699 [Bimuria novae-zelandiae CBS 107.79]
MMPGSAWHRLVGAPASPNNAGSTPMRQDTAIESGRSWPRTQTNSHASPHHVFSNGSLDSAWQMSANTSRPTQPIGSTRSVFPPSSTQTATGGAYPNVSWEATRDATISSQPDVYRWIDAQSLAVFNSPEYPKRNQLGTLNAQPTPVTAYPSNQQPWTPIAPISSSSSPDGAPSADYVTHYRQEHQSDHAMRYLQAPHGRPDLHDPNAFASPEDHDFKQGRHSEPDISLHKDDESKVLCQRCGQIFTGEYARGNRHRHLKSKHSNNTYPCEVCDKIFTRPDYRLNHYRKDHEELKVAPPTSRKG